MFRGCPEGTLSEYSRKIACRLGLLVKLQYRRQNELAYTRFLSRFHQFTNQNFQVTIKEITKKGKSLLLLKDKNPYRACHICKGTCVCDETYTGETILNVNIWWNQHVYIRTEFEPASHLRENLNHKLKWETLLQAPKSYR